MILKILKKQLQSKPMATFMSISIVSVAFCILGFFWMILQNISVQEKVEKTKNYSQFNVLIDSKSSLEWRDQILLKLNDLHESASVSLLDEAKTKQKLTKEMGEGFGDLIDDTDLPIVFLLRTPSKLSVDEEKRISTLIMSWQNVLDVDYGQKYTSSDTQNKLFNWSFLFFVVICLFVSMVLSHAVRLAFELTRKDIESFKLLGATKGFLFLPIVLESLVYALSAFVFSIVLLAMLFWWAFPSFAGYFLPEQQSLSFINFQNLIWLLVVAVLSALIGAMISYPLLVKRAQGV